MKKTSISPKKRTRESVKKINHPTKNKMLWAKCCSPYQKLRQSISWRKGGLGEEYIQAITEEYLEWAHKPTSIEPIEFRHQFGIPKRTFDKLKEDNEILNEAHEYVKEVIGMRRERLAMHKENECDPKTIHKTLHNYHPMWAKTLDDERLFRLKLKESIEEEKPTKIVVEMKDYGISGSKDSIREVQTKAVPDTTI